MKIKQFTIYSADCQPVNFTINDIRNIDFAHSCITYNFYDIEESHAFALFGIVKTAFATGNGFFGQVANAVDAYCKACHIDKPWGHQIYK